MPILDAFVGGTYQAISPTFAADQAVNVMLETRRAEGSTKTKALIGTPALVLFATGAGVGWRGSFGINDRTFAVIGTTLYEVNATTAALTSRGAITDDGLPVSFASNGKGGDQIAIVGGGELKTFDLTTNVLSAAVLLPFSGPVMVVFLDGYFLINQADSPVVWFSALEDGDTWDALDFFTRSGTADNILAIGVSRNRVWAFGGKTTTLFYDSGDADVPFVPYPETATQIGIVTPWALTLKDDTFTWLAIDALGTARVVRASGDPSPTPVSTPPIDLFLARCTRLTTARALAYGQEGHSFFVLTCPDATEDVCTYAFDEVEGLWHARAGWNSTNGRFTRWRAAGAVQAGNLVLVGDVEDARIYRLDLDTYADDGAVLRRLRRIPYVADDNQWLFITQVELAAQVGAGLTTGQGVAPVADLAISRDAAKTWISAGSATLGALGNYVARTIWRRLGRVRADRLGLEVTQTDPVKCVWLGLYLRSTAGNGQL